MNIRVGCAFSYDAAAPTATVVLVRPRSDVAHQLLDESWQIDPSVHHHAYSDLLGNRIDRLVLPSGLSTIRYDATVALDGHPDLVAPDAVQQPIETIPDDVLLYTLSSRYCPTESLADIAWHWFGATAPGWGRVQAICDWIHEHIQYGVSSTPRTTALDIYVTGGGICRDFAHLAITLCRALTIPARYVFGYMSDIDVTGPQPPMDFHAWFEAYLDGRWWTFDARFNRPRIGRIPIGYGRDAVDVAMITTYGAAEFQGMEVWADQVDDLPDDDDRSTSAVSTECSEALVRNEGRRMPGAEDRS